MTNLRAVKNVTAIVSAARAAVLKNSDAAAEKAVSVIVVKLASAHASRLSVVTFEELAARRAQLPGPVVMTNGVFDILHRGHVTYLAQARDLGKSLIVAVNSDASVKMLGKGDDRPINTEADRAAVLASLEAVDLVVIFKEKVPLKVIEEAHPDIYVKGGDYRIEDLPEAPLVASWGGRTVTVEFEYQRSTTALLEKVRGA